MNNPNKISIVSVSVLMLLVVLGCNWSTANLSSFSTSKDKEGKQATSSFKAGETLYATAQVSNNGGKVKVNLYVVVEDSKGLKKGETLKGSEVSLDIEGDKSANYNLPFPSEFPGGKFKVVADMVNEAGEKKDSKSTDFSVEPGKSTDDDSDKKSDKDSDDDKE